MARQRSRRSRSREGKHPRAIFLPWIITGAILVGTATFAFWPREAELREPQKPGETGQLIWGEGVFSSALELKAWLEARGVNYKTWARKHPEAVELLVAEPGTISVPASNAKPKQSSGTKAAAPAPKKKTGAANPANRAAREVAPVARTFAPADDDKTLFLIALVALLVAVGAALAASVSKLGASSRVTGVGVGLMLSAMCIGIGFAAAALLS